MLIGALSDPTHKLWLKLVQLLVVLRSISLMLVQQCDCAMVNDMSRTGPTPTPKSNLAVSTS
jgi:hypothetical protein